MNSTKSQLPDSWRRRSPRRLRPEESAEIFGDVSQRGYHLVTSPSAVFLGR